LRVHRDLPFHRMQGEVLESGPSMAWLMADR
jgi:hypothetical protein